jgi:hypothetical protein
MDDRDLRNYEMVLRVDGFGAENAADFPSTTFGGELFAKISASVTNLESHIAARSSGKGSAMAGTSSKTASREALQDALERISRTARAMSATTPGLKDKFRLPQHMTNQDLLGLARAFAQDALPLKNDFLRFAMPADFLDDLNELIDEFDNAIHAQQTGDNSRVMAHAAFDNELESALAAIRQLDAIVRNTYHNNPAKLAAWESARHVERAPRSKPKTPPAPAP